MMTTPGIKDKTYASLAQINITPLVDVVLVLLIIFMVTAPMMQAGVDVDLPATTTRVTDLDEERLVVTVTADQHIWLGNRQIPYQNLVETLRVQVGASGSQAVALRADKSLNYGWVLHILDRIRSAGVENVGLIVNPLDVAEAPAGAAGSGAGGGAP